MMLKYIHIHTYNIKKIQPQTNQLSDTADSLVRA